MEETEKSSKSCQALSVLIPTRNYVCVTLVEQLSAQLEKSTIPYEIIVADDGSTDDRVIKTNQQIDQLPHACYIIRGINVGRAAIRNWLAENAQYDYLLFIDSDMTIVSDYFIQRYLSAECDTVIDGGVVICGQPSSAQGRNLRYLYEKNEARFHVATERQKAPHQHLHTANLFIRRDILLSHPFDKRFRKYGYEDVLLGKVLCKAHIPILHIDNPVGFSTFEPNPDFVAKTEEGLNTLSQFSEDLRGYSRLLTFVGNIHLPIIIDMIRFWHRLFGKMERRNLCGSRPSLWLFKLYRLGYFLEHTYLRFYRNHPMG